MTYPPNPFAPIGHGAVNLPLDTRKTLPYTYVYDRILTGNQQVTNDSVSIDTGSDFYLMAWYIGTQSGSFGVRIGDASRYYYSSGLIASTSLSLFAGMPTPFISAVMFPRGSRIVIDITDTSGLSNTVELCFVGIKVF